jgi:polysaccharide biosynthesis protein PslG
MDVRSGTTLALVAVCVAICAAAPAAARALPPPVGISPGYTYERAFGAMSEAERRDAIARMHADGVAWLRLDYYPASSFDDAFVFAARQAGIRVDLLLEDFAAPPGAFAVFARRTATRFRPVGVDTFEILNEVNLYRPAIPAPRYVALLQGAYVAIKGVDAGATVIASGLGPGPGRDDPATYLRAMYGAGAKGYFDAAALHPYSYPAMPLPPPRSGCQSWNAFCAGAPALRAVMNAHGDGAKPIWFTEFGCPTGTTVGYRKACSDERLARQIAQAYAQSRAWGWVGAFFVFSWRDSASDGDFGLYTADVIRSRTSCRRSCALPRRRRCEPVAEPRARCRPSPRKIGTDAFVDRDPPSRQALCTDARPGVEGGYLPPPSLRHVTKLHPL